MDVDDVGLYTVYIYIYVDYVGLYIYIYYMYVCDIYV